MYLVNYMEGKEPENFVRKECTIHKYKWKAITTLGFWFKEQEVEEKIQLVDFRGAL